MPPGTHSAAAAVILSFLIPGGGQLLNRQYGKGAVILAFTFFGGIVIFIAAILTLGLALLLLPVLWVAQLIDAAIIAGRLNRGEPVGLWQWF